MAQLLPATSPYCCQRFNVTIYEHEMYGSCSAVFPGALGNMIHIHYKLTPIRAKPEQSGDAKLWIHAVSRRGPCRDRQATEGNAELGLSDCVWSEEETPISNQKRGVFLF